MIVWAPSFEPSAGAGTRMEVPACHVPVSTLYCVSLTPEPASLGLSVTVTSVEEKPDGTPEAVVTGFVLSTRRELIPLGLLSLPAASRTVTRMS